MHRTVAGRSSGRCRAGSPVEARPDDTCDRADPVTAGALTIGPIDDVESDRVRDVAVRQVAGDGSDGYRGTFTASDAKIELGTVGPRKCRPLLIRTLTLMRMLAP